MAIFYKTIIDIEPYLCYNYYIISDKGEEFMDILKKENETYHEDFEDMEKKLENLLFIKEIENSSCYTEKFIHNISKIKFSSKFPVILEVYLLNGKYDNYLWYYDEKEKKEGFERIKNEIKELLTEEEFEKTVKENEIDFSILNKKYSLLNQIKAQQGLFIIKIKLFFSFLF